jgi:hypothetical protein
MLTIFRFLPGLITIQFVSIFYPLLDVYKLKQLERKFGSNRHEDDNAPRISVEPKNTVSMDTLNMRLQHDPTSLLYWAYTKEFTAENVIFLTSVLNFKKRWEQVAKHTANMTPLQLRERYEEAALIFFTLVNPHTARMNINIDHKTYLELEDMFKSCSYEAFSDDSSSCSKGSSTYIENIVAPWEDFEPPQAEPTAAAADRPASSNSHTSGDSKIVADTEVDKLYQIPVTEISVKEDAAAEDLVIPPQFSLEVFDRAYEVVKRDVYLNTWVRFETRYNKPRDPAERERTMSYVSRV